MSEPTRKVFLSHTSEMAEYPAGRSFVDAAKDAVLEAGFLLFIAEELWKSFSSTAGHRTPGWRLVTKRIVAVRSANVPQRLRSETVGRLLRSRQRRISEKSAYSIFPQSLRERAETIAERSATDGVCEVLSCAKDVRQRHWFIRV